LNLKNELNRVEIFLRIIVKIVGYCLQNKEILNNEKENNINNGNKNADQEEKYNQKIDKFRNGIDNNNPWNFPKNTNYSYKYISILKEKESDITNARQKTNLNNNEPY